MHVESSAVLNRIPLELPLYGVDSFSQVLSYNCHRQPSLGHDLELLIE